MTIDELWNVFETVTAIFILRFFDWKEIARRQIADCVAF